jgi:TolA-binding protein
MTRTKNIAVLAAFVLFGCQFVSSPGTQVDDPVAECFKRYAEVFAAIPNHPQTKEAISAIKLAARPLADRQNHADVRRYLLQRLPDHPAGLLLLEEMFQEAPEKSNQSRREICAWVCDELPNTAAAAFATADNLNSDRALNPEKFLEDSARYANGGDVRLARIARLQRLQFFRSERKMDLAGREALSLLATDSDCMNRAGLYALLFSTLREGRFALQATVVEHSQNQGLLARILEQNAKKSAATIDVPEQHVTQMAQYLEHATNTCNAAYRLDVQRALEEAKVLRSSAEAMLKSSEFSIEDYTLAGVVTEASAHYLDKLSTPTWIHNGGSQHTSAAISESKARLLVANLVDVSIEFDEKAFMLAAQSDSAATGEVFKTLVANCDKHKKYGTLIEACQQFLTRFADSPLVPQVLFTLGDICVRKAATPRQGIEAWNQLMQKYPESEDTRRVAIKLGSTLVDLKEYDQAYIVLQEIIANPPDDETAAVATLLSALCEVGLGSLADGEKHIIELTERYPSSSVAPMAINWLATNALTQQKYDDAITYFTSLVERYPEHADSERARKVLETLQKMPK